MSSLTLRTACVCDAHSVEPLTCAAAAARMREVRRLDVIVAAAVQPKEALLGGKRKKDGMMGVMKVVAAAPRTMRCATPTCGDEVLLRGEEDVGAMAVAAERSGHGTAADRSHCAAELFHISF